MATIEDLVNVDRTAGSIDEWLAGFTGSDREKVEAALLSAPASKTFPIVKDLEHNPFPFKLSALNSWVHRKRVGL